MGHRELRFATEPKNFSNMNTQKGITLHKLNAINKIIHCLIQISIKKGCLNNVV